jgi:hypothetical protein
MRLLLFRFFLPAGDAHQCVALPRHLADDSESDEDGEDEGQADGPGVGAQFRGWLPGAAFAYVCICGHCAFPFVAKKQSPENKKACIPGEGCRP